MYTLAVDLHSGVAKVGGGVGTGGNSKLKKMFHQLLNQLSTICLEMFNSDDLIFHFTF